MGHMIPKQTKVEVKLQKSEVLRNLFERSPYLEGNQQEFTVSFLSEFVELLSNMPFPNQ